MTRMIIHPRKKSGVCSTASAMLALIWAVCLVVLAGIAVYPPSLIAAEGPKKDPSVIIIGGDRDYPPYEFIDKDGQPAGYNVELTRAIAEVMGIKVEFRLGGWAEMRDALQSGKIDVLQGMSYS